MYRAMKAVSFVTALAMGAGTAHAGVYNDDLTRCVVKSASPKDQKLLVTWVFAAISAHPEIRAYSNLVPGQRETFTKETGLLMERLLTVDCRPESVLAIKYEGADSVTGAFTVLGQVAMRGLMTDPDVAKVFSSMADSVDKAKLEALGTEAGK